MTAFALVAYAPEPELADFSAIAEAPPYPEAACTNAPLIEYALKGLRRCWMPERGRYSHLYRLDAAKQPNVSLPESDAFYTLNVLLGISRLGAVERSELPDLALTYEGCCREAANPRFRTYAYGMALWVGAQLGLDPPVAVVDRVLAVAADRRALDRLTAQDVGMLISGTTAMALAEGGIWQQVTRTLVEHLCRHYRHPKTGLFYNQARGIRRRFASFASQVYPILALYHYGEAFAAGWALDIANRAAAQVIARQGQRGEWPWFFSVPSGRVLDVYEVYSVHQHGMAPAFLRHAVAHGVDGAREALVKGFLWLLGDNAMGVSMLRPQEGMFYRSQARFGELESSWPRARRSITNALRRRDDTPETHRRLVLRQECRSYELGWILWSFAGRSDYPELTQRPEFAA